MAPPAFPPPVYPSMEALEETSPLRQYYPETLYPNGNYYPSPYGRTKYWIIGPESGKKIVLVHGISAPSIVFRYVAPELASKGFRVLLYDTYGRGYSQAPKIAHEPTIYALQLALLLQYIGWNKVNVAGFSMGGSITATFSSLFPHLIDESVVFVSSAGLMESRRVQATQVAAAKDNAQPSTTNVDPNALRLLQAENLPGFREVIASCVQNGILTELQWAFETLGKSSGTRFLIIHGTADQTVPFGEAAKIQKFIPQAEVFPIEGASHYLVVEEGYWQKVTTKLAEFFA